MKRKIIEINEEKCNGCGLCATACHEGAIGMADDKAKLLRDDYCDGLGNCLPICPTGAITFVEREAAAYDDEAVRKNLAETAESHDVSATAVESELRQWPVQIRLIPINAPCFEGAELLIAADCAAYARADFHSRFMRGKVTLIGCPKLDDVDYSEKLTGIIHSNGIKSVTIVRMEVPCCGGIEQATVTALKDSGKSIPWQVVTLTTRGHVE